MTDKIASTLPGAVPAVAPAAERTGYETDESGTARFWSSEDGPSFGEFLDIINPLQHIPVISTIYRAITGDQIGQGPRLMGGAIFGGPAGIITSGIAGLFEEMSGGSVGTHVANLIEEIIGGDTDTAVARDDAPSVGASAPAAAEQAMTQQAPGRQAAELSADAGDMAVGAVAAKTAAATVPAAAMNRIALNPAAALGVPLQQPAGAGRGTPPAFPAFPTARRAAGPFPAFPNGAPTARHAPPASMPAHSNSDADRVRAAAAQARQTKADALLARWAEKQMAKQSTQGDPADPSRPETTDRGRNPAAHPMAAPENASPEWYASAMKAALARYQAARNTPALGPAGVQITR